VQTTAVNQSDNEAVTADLNQQNIEDEGHKL